MSRDEPRDSAGESRICRVCGLCCSALLHARAEVGTEERGTVESMGLSTFAWRDRFAFALPCPKLADTECSIYPTRPTACARFRCRLLRAFDDEELSLEQCLAVVHRARELWRSLTRETDAARDEGIWSAVARHSETAGESVPSPSFRLHTVALLTLVRRRFAGEDFEPYGRNPSPKSQ